MHEVVLDTEENTVLVAYMPTPKDLAIARTQGWYRIPVTHAPPIITQGKATHIAFYQPSSFGDDRYRVRWYSPISSLAIRSRLDVLPTEIHHPSAQKQYYVVGCSQLQELPVPIRSRRPRRPIFFPTTLKKLMTATDINHLFNDSPLENLLWSELLKADIPAERQFDIKVGRYWLKLDFALFCKTRKIDVECDSDTHHLSQAAVEKDKWRSNMLAREGWNVLRFTSSMLRKEMRASMSMVAETVSRYGGIESPGAEGGYRYPLGPDDAPRLFD